MSTGIIFFWVVVSVIVGYVATQKDRSFAGFFFLSLIISPLISLLILIALPAPVLAVNPQQQQNKMRLCPFCAESIKHEAIKCKHCGSDVEKTEEDELAIKQGSTECSVPKEDWVTISCPSCKQEDSTPYPMNTAYYNNFNAKEQTFSPAINLSCKQCGHKFKYGD